jgi:hypothetical protein
VQIWVVLIFVRAVFQGSHVGLSMKLKIFVRWCFGVRVAYCIY